MFSATNRAGHPSQVFTDDALSVLGSNLGLLALTCPLLAAPDPVPLVPRHCAEPAFAPNGTLEAESSDSVITGFCEEDIPELTDVG